MTSYRIAVLPGDGIGKEVVPEGMRVLEAAGRRFDIKFRWDTFSWSCETYKRTGRMMPEDGIDQLRKNDAIFLGAVGFPGVPDHISLWGLLIPIRRLQLPWNRPSRPYWRALRCELPIWEARRQLRNLARPLQKRFNPNFLYA
ncbi:MAG: hypothetical protein H8D96_17520 [Desulfobacterales bacterium]|uniref:Isopropylmalate dehydrogenase-like domain-containing protein n=1 Tax=Candidatus Desulfatibia vada TaxID=2841696 RepID=A0A8J6P5A8_9BACT|nr:hypothetical protein [Candidatus Desulfatibia vada]MBL6971536.1 hypothetical protein [Desulfobacterales bacterium]MBL7218450.1 hypothetical protein [Desulfobacteraceae bacterium]